MIAPSHHIFQNVFFVGICCKVCNNLATGTEQVLGGKRIPIIPAPFANSSTTETPNSAGDVDDCGDADDCVDDDKYNDDDDCVDIDDCDDDDD